MNRLTIIGNCTKDPELRTTTAGKNVCSFNVAVNRRKKGGAEEETDFFRVTAWDGLAENCAKFVKKGKKVAVIGSVSLHVYTNAKGEPAANMEVNALEVEFISPRNEQIDTQTGFEKVEPDDLPY